MPPLKNADPFIKGGFLIQSPLIMSIGLHERRQQGEGMQPCAQLNPRGDRIIIPSDSLSMPNDCQLRHYSRVLRRVQQAGGAAATDATSPASRAQPVTVTTTERPAQVAPCAPTEATPTAAAASTARRNTHHHSSALSFHLIYLSTPLVKSDSAPKAPRKKLDL